MTVFDRLNDLGIVLPHPASPIASYLPAVATEDTLYLSGQLPFRVDGSLILGRVGEDLSLDEGVEAARACSIMILAQAKAALGDLDRIARVLKLGVFVNSAAAFTQQPAVANGASELMQSVFGDAGRHARSAVGVPTLPLGVAVEVDCILSFKPSRN